MRKMLMRTCRGRVCPGGPCALELRIAREGISTEITCSTAFGITNVPDRFEASVSLSDTAGGTVRECIAQWEHSPTGSPKAAAFGSGLEADSSIESIAICPISSPAISDIVDSGLCLLHETCPDRRCGQRAAMRKLPP